MPVVTRSMKKMHDAAISEAELQSPITELPPEMLEMILKNLDSGKNSLLLYRLVHSSWKTIIDDLLEKKSLKMEIVARPNVSMIDSESRFWCPPAILRHTGNPFPSRSLRIHGHRIESQRPSNISLVAFMARFGNFLTTIELYMANLKTKTLLEALNHLPNLKTLRIGWLQLLDLNNEDILESVRLPPLLNLTSLILYAVNVGPRSEENDQSQFQTKLLDAYANQLVSLEICVRTETLEELFPNRRVAFQNLRQLKVYLPNAAFFRLKCFHALRRISIVGPSQFDRTSIGTIMQFVDKFNDSLETLEVDILWSYLKPYGPANERASKETNIAGDKRFPKLTKFTVPYPSNDLESAVILKKILIKFPSLKELELRRLHYRDVYFNEHRNLEDQFYQTYREKIRTLLVKEDYWKLCSKLNRISVWFTGEWSCYSCRSYIFHYTPREVVGEGSK